MLTAWRIVKREHLATAFSGDGAALFPGRWNSANVPVVYASSSISLAILELLVHAREWNDLPELRLIEVRFAGNLVISVARKNLPRNWRREEIGLNHTRKIGDRWFAERKSVILQVPSAITGEPNFVLNPRHANFPKVAICKPTRLALNERLFPEMLIAKRRP
jgi:RES domain-containing protein